MLAQVLEAVDAIGVTPTWRSSASTATLTSSADATESLPRRNECFDGAERQVGVHGRRIRESDC